MNEETFEAVMEAVRSRLTWDLDSLVTFHADGHTVHDFDRRFTMEDEGLIPPTGHSAGRCWTSRPSSWRRRENR